MNEHAETSKTVRVVGDVKSPTSVSVSELMAIAVGLEKTLIELCKARQKQEKKGTEAIKISLTAIEEGSLRLEFYSKSPQFEASYEQIITVARSGLDALREMPQKAQKSLEQVVKFLDQHNSQLELFSAPLEKMTEDMMPAAVLDWGLEDESIYLEGYTSLYGELIGITGIQTPTAVLKLDDNSQIKCKLPDEEMARELGSRLYKQVGLYGKATWLYDDNNLKKFTVEDILPYEGRGDYAAMFCELREEFGKYYDGIDPSQFPSEAWE